MAHIITFGEALREHEDQARKLGAALVLLEQNQHELRNKQEELRHWTSSKRPEFFLQSIRHEHKTIRCEGLRLQSELGLLRVTLEKTRSDVQLLAKGGQIVRL